MRPQPKLRAQLQGTLTSPAPLRGCPYARLTGKNDCDQPLFPVMPPICAVLINSMVHYPHRGY